MAYARKGEKGSAIYLWTDGEFWHCTDCPMIKTDWKLECEPDAYGALGYHLLEHLSKGQHVPDEVFDRLRAEMEGVPYETDAMRALREYPDE